MNGYNFTERVRTSLSFAREEAVRLHHEYVGTEHILLGIVREGNGVATTVLQNLGVSLDSLHFAVEQVVRRGTMTVTGPDLPYTSRAKKVLELAMSQARDLGHAYVGTEHTLLGLLAEQRGVAAQVLHDAGVTLDSARAETLRIIEVPAAAPSRVRPRAAHPTARPSTRRVDDIMNAAQRVAFERQASSVLPAHAMIALLEHDGGMANVVLDRLGLERSTAMSALNDLAPLGSKPVPPDAVLPTAELRHALAEGAKLQEGNDASLLRSEYFLLALIQTSAELRAVLEAQDITPDDVLDEIRYISG